MPFWGSSFQSNTMLPGRRPNGICSIQPFGHNRHMPQIGGSALSGGRGAGSPSNKMWSGSSPTCMLSFVLIHPTVWPPEAYTNVADRTVQTDRQDTQREVYKRSPKNDGRRHLGFSKMAWDIDLHATLRFDVVQRSRYMAIFERPFIKRLALCYQTIVLSVLSCLSVTMVYCGQTVGWIDTKLGMQVGLWPWPHCVRWGPATPPTKGHSPQFSAHIFCGQMAGLIKIPLGMEVGLGPGNFVLDVDPATTSPKGSEPPILGP